MAAGPSCASRPVSSWSCMVASVPLRVMASMTRTRHRARRGGRSVWRGAVRRASRGLSPGWPGVARTDRQSSVPGSRWPRMSRSSSPRKSASSSGPRGAAQSSDTAVPVSDTRSSAEAYRPRPAGCRRKAASAADPSGRASRRGHRDQQAQKAKASSADRAPTSHMRAA
jgi:hypothetical protein